LEKTSSQNAKTINLAEDSKNIFKIEETVEIAISRLQELDCRLTRVCKEIQDNLGFDLVTIQLIRPEEQIIEAVSGSGISSKWIGQARHYIEPREDLRDIQADVVQTCKTEIIAGWDSKNRFDKWLYEKYQHQNLGRIFTPIILVQNDRGLNDKNWFEGLSLDNIFVENEYLNADWFNDPRDHQPEDVGQNQSCSLLLPEAYCSENFEILVIGTIEAGFDKPDRPITLEQVLNLIKMVGEKALYIRQSQLPCVLDQITESAMTAVQADAASLHFLGGILPQCLCFSIGQDGKINPNKLEGGPECAKYVYNVFSGQIGRRFLRNCPPRVHGLGSEALREHQIKTIPDYEERNFRLLEEFNITAFKSGIRAMAAFPLFVEEHRGVLYIHYKEEHEFCQEEISWLELFSNRVKDAIQHALKYIRLRDQAKQLLTLHTVAHALAHMPDNDALLEQIAWNVLNVLAADAITIHKFIEPSNTFDPPPALAGRFRDIKEAKKDVNGYEIPFKLIH
jgi:GAF domain-containing protein